MVLAHADEPTDTITLRDVEVSARRRPIATVQSLAGKELQALSTTSIADALKYFAGVQIKDYGGLGGMKTINVRSLGAQHVGVYIDGIRINNAQNGTVDLGKYSLSTLESVSLYNANKLDKCQSASEYASGATVYMRTRRPTSDSLSVMARIASFHTYSGRVNAQFKRKGWSGFLDGEYLNSRGDYKFRYKSEYEDTVGTRANSDIEYGRVEAAVFKGGFSSHLYGYFSQRGCPGGIVRRLSDKYTNVGREWDKDIFAQASYQHDFGSKFQFKANSKYAYEYLRYCTDYPENQNTAKVDNHYRQHDAYLSALGAYTPWRFVTVNIGYDARMSWLDADLKRFELVRRLDQKAVIAAQGEYRGFRLAASMLYQHYKDYTKLKVGAADPLQRFTPAISAGYTYKNLTVKAWYKKIFRSPTLNDLYFQPGGNPDLRPEKGWTWDTGIEWSVRRAKTSYELSATFFESRIDDWILWVNSGTKLGIFTPMNVRRVRSCGAEANARADVRPHADWRLLFDGHFAWTRSVNRGDPFGPNDRSVGRQLVYIPEFSGAFTARLSWRSWTASWKWCWYSRRFTMSSNDPGVLGSVAPYLMNDVSLEKVFDRRRVRISLKGCVNNLFNEDYVSVQSRPMARRNYAVYVGITPKFGRR